MEHYKSRNNDFYHFTNPHDDRSELGDDDYDYEHNYDYDNFDDDDDRSFDFNYHPRYINPIFSTYGVVNENDASVEEVGAFDDQAALVFQLDERMKSLADKLQHTIDDIGTRVSRLDDETSKIDKCVEDVKNYEEMHNGTTHRKLRRMQSILQEVQDGVLYLRDKHEIAETQLQLAKLQVSKMDKKVAAQTNPQQQQQPSPASQLSSHIPLTPFINQLPSNGVTFWQPVSYHPAVSQSPKINAQQLVIPPNQQFWTPYESKADHQLPHYIESCQGVVGPRDHPFMNNPSPKTWNVSSYDTPSNRLPQLMHVESSRNYKSEFHAKYMPEIDNFYNTHTHGGLPSSYETSHVIPVESSFHPHKESRSNRTHTPVIQALPHALPTAVDLEEGSNSEENGNAIPIDDIVDKVTAMGFRRDLVRACVRKLTMDGSMVDLNAVLDGMMKNKMI